MLTEARIRHLVAHWDAKEPLCKECERDWSAADWSDRKEVKHDYLYETDEGDTRNYDSQL